LEILIVDVHGSSALFKFIGHVYSSGSLLGSMFTLIPRFHVHIDTRFQSSSPTSKVRLVRRSPGRISEKNRTKMLMVKTDEGMG
jgi:hypothetical protein